MDPRDIIRETAPQLGDIGASSYFAPLTRQRATDLGLDGFRFYFLGRGGVLGDVESSVVSAAFGYFEPGLVDKMWSSAKQIVDPRQAAEHYLQCAYDLGQQRYGGVEGLDTFVNSASVVIAALEGAALPLFVAFRSQPVPDDRVAAAVHQAVVLRELRGSVHLLALAASGLDSRRAHGVRRPADFALFGYDAPIEVTDADQAAWERAENLTNEILLPAYSRLSDVEAGDLIAGVQAMHSALSR